MNKRVVVITPDYVDGEPTGDATWEVQELVGFRVYEVVTAGMGDSINDLGAAIEAALTSLDA